MSLVHHVNSILQPRNLKCFFKIKKLKIIIWATNLSFPHILQTPPTHTKKINKFTCTVVWFITITTKQQAICSKWKSSQHSSLSLEHSKFKQTVLLPFWVFDLSPAAPESCFPIPNLQTLQRKWAARHAANLNNFVESAIYSPNKNRLTRDYTKCHPDFFFS